MHRSSYYGAVSREGTVDPLWMPHDVERAHKIDELIEAGWGDVPWKQIPENWREVDPKSIVHRKPSIVQRKPMPKLGELHQAQMERHAAEMRARTMKSNQQCEKESTS